MPVNRACYVPPPSPPAYTPQTTVVVCCPLISDPVLRASVCAIFVNVWFGASPVNCLIDRQTVLIIAAFIVTAELSWVCIVYWTVANPVVVQRLCLSLGFIVSLAVMLQTLICQRCWLLWSSDPQRQFKSHWTKEHFRGEMGTSGKPVPTCLHWNIRLWLFQAFCGY